MRERPIIFSAPMVRAILHGTKMQTRRVAKGVAALHTNTGEALARCDSAGPRVICPYGQPGDRLWVRESLTYCPEYGHAYAADGTFLCSVFDDPEEQTGYSYECDMREDSVASIHLPRRWSRITLEVTGVRVEKLQDISEADALAEGVTAGKYHGLERANARAYSDLWESINGPGSWDANPWIWVVEFRRLTT